MYSCPRCRIRLGAGVTRCGDCGADVTLLARLDELPDWHFNQALAAYRRGDLTSAATLAGALLAARTTDAEGWLLTAHIQAAAGGREEVCHACRMVALLRPDDGRLSQAVAALERYLAPAVPAPPPEPTQS